MSSLAARCLVTRPVTRLNAAFSAVVDSRWNSAGSANPWKSGEESALSARWGVKNNSSFDDVCSSPPAMYLVGVWCWWVGAGPGCGDPGAGTWSGALSSSDESGIDEDESMYTTKCLRARWFLGLAGSLCALGFLGALRAVSRGGALDWLAGSVSNGV